MLKSYFVNTKLASFILLFSVSLISFGQNIHGHGQQTPHKELSELEQDFNDCKKISIEKKNSCFRDLYRECSKTVGIYRARYGLRSNNSPSEFDKVLKLRLNVASEIQKLNKAPIPQ
jgi:hypothetical protein